MKVEFGVLLRASSWLTALMDIVLDIIYIQQGRFETSGLAAGRLPPVLFSG